MKQAKKEALTIIKGLPENASMDEIQYHLYIREKVAGGLSEVREGRVLETAEVKKRMGKWLAK